MKRLKGKVAIVTGGGSGIGRAAAVLFAKEGAKVAAVDICLDLVQETDEIIREAGGESTPIENDVSSAKDVKQMIATTVNKYGKLNILVNNAAILRNEGFVADCTEEVFDEVLAVNFKSVWLCMKYAIPEMLNVGGGAIVNNASIAAFFGQPGLGVYSAAKGAIISISKVAAMEYADKNIRINCVLPGHIGTPLFYSRQTPDVLDGIKATTFMHRIGEPEEVARAMLFLASDESSWTTGSALTTDGGVSTRHP